MLVGTESDRTSVASCLVIMVSRHQFVYKFDLLCVCLEFKQVNRGMGEVIFHCSRRREAIHMIFVFMRLLDHERPVVRNEHNALLHPRTSHILFKWPNRQGGFWLGLLLAGRFSNRDRSYLLVCSIVQVWELARSKELLISNFLTFNYFDLVMWLLAQVNTNNKKNVLWTLEMIFGGTVKQIWWLVTCTGFRQNLLLPDGLLISSSGGNKKPSFRSSFGAMSSDFLCSRSNYLFFLVVVEGYYLLF